MSDFTARDFQDLNVTVSIIKQVGKTHFGLGALTALLKVFDIANMGICIIGRGGIGKTTAIKALEQIAHKQLFATEFTQAGVTPEFNSILSNADTTWICYDLSKMSVYFAENMFRVVCALLTDHEIKTYTSMYSLEIENANVSWIGAATYPIYKRLILSDLWDGTYRERICRIYQFPYRRKFITENVPILKVNPRQFESIGSISCPDEYKVPAAKLLSNQFSMERTTVYSPNLLRASASLNHRKEVTEADLKFLRVFEFSFQVEHRLGKRLGLASPLYLDAEAVALAGIVLEYPGITARKIYEMYRTPEQYTVNCCMSNLDIFVSPDVYAPYEDKRLFLKPELLSMVNRQYDFEELCLRVPY